MARINVYRQYTEEELYQEASYTEATTGRPWKPELIGWFDPDKAEVFPEDTEWNGSNRVSVATGSQWAHERLYRTRQGRWVLAHWSQVQGDTPWDEFITGDKAREWLLINHHDESAARLFGPVPEEQGPGRPAVGAAVNLRLGDELLARVDAYAAGLAISRAEAVRRLAAVGLGVGVD